VTHPNESRLALYAGDDLPLPARLRVAIHLRACDRCDRQVEELRGIRDWMRLQETETPAGIRWGALASEMKANIRLGLAAGRCVDVPEPLEVPRGFRWPAPAMALPVLLLVIAGWMLQSMQPPPQLASTDFVVDASSSGIGVQRDGRGFTLLQPRNVNVVYSVNGEAAGARYVDSESGQVTISHVYAQ
jgi:anti-sigma factor RsiW